MREVLAVLRDRRRVVVLALLGSVFGLMAAAPAAESLLGATVVETAYAKDHIKDPQPVEPPGRFGKEDQIPDNAASPTTGVSNSEHRHQ